jgi:hypothetical protein
MALLLSTLAFSAVALPPPSSWAYRDYFTPEQKAQLDKIQTVRVEAIAITDQGSVDAAPIAELVARRMGELGYTVVGDASTPHDVVIKVKCEQHGRVQRLRGEMRICPMPRPGCGKALPVR